MTDNEKLQATLVINRANADAKSVLAEIHDKLTLLDDLMPVDTEADAAFAAILVQTAIIDGEIDLAWPVVKHESDNNVEALVQGVQTKGVQVDIDGDGIPDIEIKPVAPAAPPPAPKKKGTPKK